MKFLFRIFAFLTPVFLLGMTAEEKENFWYKSPEIRLYRKRNRGFFQEMVLKKRNFKIPAPRQTPRAVFHPRGKTQKSGKLVYTRVPIRLKEEAGSARDAWIRLGFPLPAGGVFQTENLRVLDNNGREIPSQRAITGFWPDNSIKWILVQFSAPLKAHEEKNFYLEAGNKIKAQKYAGLTFTENEKEIVVDTGKLTAVIDKKKCITCFCCQEFCPKGAMKVHRPLIARILNHRK